MRQTFIFLLIASFLSCSAPKRAFQDYSKNHDFSPRETYALKDFSRTSQVISESEEFPLIISSEDYVTPEEQNLFEANTKTLPTSFDKLERSQVKQRLRELKTQLSSLEQVELPADSLISAFDQNFIKAKKQGIWAFVLSLAASISISSFLFVPFFIGSIVLGVMSLKKYKKSFNKKFRALPIIALVIDGIWIVLFLLVILFLILWFSGGSF